MSKAFTKEDDSIPERSVRRRAGSGLPPGALNYLTADGAERMQTELAQIAPGSQRATELAGIFASAIVVNPPSEPPEGAVFGAWLELRATDGEMRRHRITGADETGLDPEAASWVSPLGRALLGCVLGEKVKLDGDLKKFTVVRIWY